MADQIDQTDPTVPVPPTAAPARSRSRPWFWFALVVILASWFAGLLGAYLGATLADRPGDPPRRPSTLGLVTTPPRAEALPTMDVAAVADAVGASVVAVQAINDGEARAGQSLGTGVIVTADGEIVTNAHVVEGASSVHVRLPGESEPRLAGVVAVDRSSDLALLRVDASGLAAATFAAPGDVHLGDQVVAIGYALDLDGDPSVTLGIVSALDRTLATADRVLAGLIQTDAAISSGNSGGPLVNARGEVIGINTLIALDQIGGTPSGLGFAIANGQVLARIEAMRREANGEPAGSSALLGVLLGDRTDGGSGALVVEVTPDSPAEAVGIEVGDVVIAVDDVTITGQLGLVSTIRGLAPGTEVELTIVRGGATRTLAVTLAERTDD